MDFDRLVQFIKDDGCPVKIYDKPIMKVAQCIGTFDVSKKGNPIICMAVKGHTKLELLRILLHEYAHYRQWVEGFMGEAESVVEGWDILDEWLRGKKYSEEDLRKARNCVILLEYDAEIRTIQLSRNLGVDLGDIEDFLDNAHSYVTHLKTVFHTRKWSQYQEYGLRHRKLRPEEILAPLTEEEKSVLEE